MRRAQVRVSVSAMRGIVAFVLVLGFAMTSVGPASAAAVEPCKDLKLAQARAVLGQSAALSQKQVIRERVCSVKYGGSPGATVRSESATDFDYTVAGLKDAPEYVKKLKAVSLGAKGYSYDRYAIVNGKSTFTSRVLFFRVGARMYTVEVPASRLLPAAKHLTLARHVASNARGK